MSEPKPFASLSSGLLARKGAARPAMRPQGFGQQGAGLDDLGWNDMGGEHPAQPAGETAAETHAFSHEVIDHPRAGHSLGLSPVESPVHSQQAEIADRFAVDSDEEAFDEEYDETAEPYDPDAPFVSHEDEQEIDEEGEDEEDTAFELDTPVAFDPAPSPAPFAPKKKMMALDAPSAEDYAVQPEAMDQEAACEPVASHETPAASLPIAFVTEPEPVAQIPAVETAPEPVAVAPVEPAVAPRRAPKPRSAVGQKGKAAFTLRLDPERHLKLRLACAMDGRSAQMLVTAALDQLLAEMPELQDMAAKANRKG